MLVISRKRDESVVLFTSDGPITVELVDIRGNKVRLGFDAPADVCILREEHCTEAMLSDARRKHD